MSKDDAGCLTLIGLLILSISVGELYGGVYG